MGPAGDQTVFLSEGHSAELQRILAEEEGGPNIPRSWNFLREMKPRFSVESFPFLNV